MTAIDLNGSIQYLKGVGPQRAAAFAEIGVHTIGQLLEIFPASHEEDSGAVSLENLRPGRIATVRGAVLDIRYRSGGGLTLELSDGDFECILRWFQRPASLRVPGVGELIEATGEVRLYADLPELQHPQIRSLEHADATPARDTRMLGVYRSRGELTSPLLRRILHGIVTHPGLHLPDFLPPELLRKRRLPDRTLAVRHMHIAPSRAALDLARARLAYEELLLLELAMALRRRRRLALHEGRKLLVTPEIDRRIRARFPFALTASQDRVVADIRRDLGSGRPMTRLIQGDVGCGKTVVALYACLTAVAHRAQAAIMAPTEILAAQHFNNIERYLAGSQVRRTLLRGGMPPRERAAAVAAIEAGEIDLIVGTQALIQKDVAFGNLALVVVDEQHKFGVLQRAQFRTKGPMPHYLVMTATPIPRTLSMTVFGDLDCSVIRSAPPGRGRTLTRVVTAGQWNTVMQYVRKRLELGEQAYVVCPRVGKDAAEGDDEATAASAGSARRAQRSVRDVFEKLSSGPWAGLNLATLHGGMPSADKRRVIEDFAAGRTHAVISTTVVEVGLDVPSATIMVVEHADRFGLSQLHQLRGRVGRGARDALCVLIGHGDSAKARERLGVLATTTDGFRIAEADLRLRGPGELFGTRQHGLPELLHADLIADFELLEHAREDAFAIVAADPKLARPEHAALLPALRRMFGEKLKLIDAA